MILNSALPLSQKTVIRLTVLLIFYAILAPAYHAFAQSAARDQSHPPVGQQTIPLSSGNTATSAKTISQAAKEAAAKEAAAKDRAADKAWKSGLAGSFLSSRFARQHQDIDEAANYLAQSLTHDPDNLALKQESMRAQVMAGNMQAAIKLAQDVAKQEKHDPLVATLLMIDFLHKGDYSKANAVIALPSDRGLFGIIKPVLSQWLSIASGGLTAPVNMQETIDKSGFFAPFLYYHAALMNDVLGFKDIARKNYEKANEDPAISSYRVVEALSNFYLRSGENEKAQAVFDNYARENPESNLIPEAILAQKKYTVSPLVANPTEGLAELFFSTASILFGEEMTTESVIYLQLALALRPEFPPAQLMLANLYENNQEYQEAIRLYEAIKPGTVFYKRAQIRKALNIEALGHPEKAIAQLETIVDNAPTDVSALITLGDIYREQKRYENAINAYTKAITLIGSPKASDWPLLYARGIAFERSAQWKFAEQDFFTALKLSPDQPEVLNYLGYSWLIMHQQLDKAFEYITIAANARPEDAHIIDSLGWAYYVKGDYDKALEALEKAADLMPQDPTVNDHLGDVYYEVGRRNEARYQWNRALNFNPEKADAERIRLKISGSESSSEAFRLRPRKINKKESMAASDDNTPDDKTPHKVQ